MPKGQKQYRIVVTVSLIAMTCCLPESKVREDLRRGKFTFDNFVSVALYVVARILDRSAKHFVNAGKTLAKPERKVSPKSLANLKKGRSYEPKKTSVETMDEHGLPIIESVDNTYKEDHTELNARREQMDREFEKAMLPDRDWTDPTID
jgi:hypothetical protein